MLYNKKKNSKDINVLDELYTLKKNEELLQMNLNIKNLQSSKIIIFSMIIRQEKKPKIQIQNLVLLSSL
jgi:hypothetical protein